MKKPALVLKFTLHSDSFSISTVYHKGIISLLGLDLAVDTNGRLWLIEINAKPNKDLVVGIDDFDGFRPQYSAIFDYAGFLCGMKE